MEQIRFEIRNPDGEIKCKPKAEEEEMRTLAAIISKGGDIAGYTYTTAKNGDIVSYGKIIGNGSPTARKTLHEIGRAKISRNRRYLKDIKYLYNEYSVNYGGGDAV